MVGSSARDPQNVKNVKNVLAPEAFRGWAGQWARNLKPLTEADPVAILAMALGALGHNVRQAVRVQGQPLSELMVFIGDERARVAAAWGYVGHLFSAGGTSWTEGLHTKTLPLPKLWPAWTKAWNQGTASLLGWCRQEEVSALLKPRAGRSDLAARMLFLGVREGTPQPLGDAVPEGIPLDTALELKASLEFAEKLSLDTTLEFYGKRGLTPEEALQENLIPGKLVLDEEAAKLWERMYPVLQEPRNAGTMIDNMTELAERHVLRLAGLYAVIDRSKEITIDHLLAALAVWDYHEATVYDLFPHYTGDAKQDQVLRYLRERPGGVTQNEVNLNPLQKNRVGGAGPILNALKRLELVEDRKEPGSRQPRLWFPTEEALGLGSERRSFLSMTKGFLREARKKELADEAE